MIYLFNQILFLREFFIDMLMFPVAHFTIPNEINEGSEIRRITLNQGIAMLISFDRLRLAEELAQV